MKFKDLNVIRMSEDQETRFFESVFDQFTILRHMEDTSLSAPRQLRHFKEALLYALYKGIAEGMQQQREASRYAEEYWTDLEYFPRFLEHLVEEIQFDAANIISLLQKPWKWEQEYKLWRHHLPEGKLMDRMRDLPIED